MIKRKCKNCGKAFSVYPPAKIKEGRGIYCSMQCRNEGYSKEKSGKGKGELNSNWKNAKKKMICEGCGKEFNAYLDKNHKGRFCSKKCFFVMMRKCDTDIEKIIEQWLKDNNIKFEKQIRIGRYDVPDFFIKPNYCVYADGDYWHLKEKAKERDRRINDRLTKLGYVVIRLLGSEIKNGKRPKIC